MLLKPNRGTCAPSNQEMIVVIGNVSGGLKTCHLEFGSVPSPPVSIAERDPCPDTETSHLRGTQNLRIPSNNT